MKKIDAAKYKQTNEIWLEIRTLEACDLQSTVNSTTYSMVLATTVVRVSKLPLLIIEFGRSLQYVIFVVNGFEQKEQVWFEYVTFHNHE